MAGGDDRDRRDLPAACVDAGGRAPLPAGGFPGPIGATETAAGDEPSAVEGWSRVEAGAWLGQTLDGLRGPGGLTAVDPGADLRGTLRAYQKVGVSWLSFASSLKLGVCLADDMGLGK